MNDRSHGVRESTVRLVILRTGIPHRVATVSPPKRKRWQITEKAINAESRFFKASGRTRTFEKLAETRNRHNGIEEVVGSIPSGSTNNIRRLSQRKLPNC